MDGKGDGINGGGNHLRLNKRDDHSSLMLELLIYSLTSSVKNLVLAIFNDTEESSSDEMSGSVRLLF